MAFFDIGNRPTTVVDGIEEIEHMESRSSSGIQVDALFRDVFGKFFLFQNYVEVYFLSWPERYKVAFSGTDEQCSLFPVEGKRPGILGVGRRTPGSMLPYAVEFFILEVGYLRIFYIGLCCFLYVDAAC